jgi:hypothetical protein
MIPATSRTSQQGWRSSLLALAIGLVLAAVVLEGLLRVFPQYALSPSLMHELRWQATSHQGPDVNPNEFFEMFSPELGWDLKPHIRYGGVTSNSQRLRGQREYAPEPPPGVRRVLCVGDSFVFGAGLTDEETMPAQLETALNVPAPGRWEVLNLAVSGYGTDQQYLRLLQLGFSYSPDIVVLGFFEEDVRRNALSFREYAKPYFEVSQGTLVLRNVPVPPPEAVRAQRLELPRSYIFSFLRRLPDYAVDISELPLPDIDSFDPSRSRRGRVTLAILDAMRDAVVQHHTQFFLLIIPRWVVRWGTGNERMLRRWAERTGTAALVLREAYLELPATERAGLYHGHWTAKGARVTAQLLATELLRR